MSRIVVVGAGLGGLAASALLAQAGHEVTLLERASTVGGKSRRLDVDGERIDSGPSLVTFPGVWDELRRRLGAAGDAGEIELERLPEVGRYHFDGEEVTLPVPPDHRWYPAWKRFSDLHAPLAGDVTSLLVADPLDRRSLPALRRLLAVYGARLSTRAYLDGLTWMPDGLREIIAIHTLNAGVSPSQTPALYASMPAVMAESGVWVPRGGVYEIPLALARMADAAGVDIRTGEAVTRIERGRVTTAGGSFAADLVVTALDADRVAELRGRRPRPARALSCSAVAIYGALRESLPAHIAAHSVILPTKPEALFRSLAAGDEPADTMAFVNLYRAGETYPNRRSTVAVLLTAPADGSDYSLEHPFVRREVDRISRAMGLDGSITELMTDAAVLDPRYFGSFGEPHGALYGAARPLWMSGPFHRPAHHDPRTPWLWRVGASVHPGGGIPAVLGGAMIVTSKLLARHPA
ncbi:NAD(P)/FAD-dependent oxidoreductase [Microbacterium sp. EYE_5]|uniref:phytoene desaturase family protein n=1 Tax=unclassified Microbacterium TaxID=2609290 RepID=UPI002004A02D|nr:MULTISPECIES: NAD(P)/FAD-dependent oxidoreductase [unclassified Microbacterium]MCK6079547.1 NAD(P)/FAD-dependent oxidoreductase [Microbacterium sp. EYE_382]MCK6084817.1 NAD(P)/FAD-dependent oxidoreductase [Microbacterium sp. EYE_384]MCK6122956.1 NAD(P)/FAD-dependent oxidoreductase [Microbacterium sp. EYE_80]MCK6125581.1 NAD(P)/FAD-dependent oxidoreductase [Microbacterium sp. EYE_79]MCK6140501.1 NAD(P)/FAD-dependent oxidoreductase [Microbacterium sp. EYE_39]